MCMPTKREHGPILWAAQEGSLSVSRGTPFNFGRKRRPGANGDLTGLLCGNYAFGRTIAHH
jgi:hypothetical protein